MLKNDYKLYESEYQFCFWRRIEQINTIIKMQMMQQSFISARSPVT